MSSSARKQKLLIIIVMFSLWLVTSSNAQGQTVNLYDNFTDWMSAVSAGSMDEFLTTAANVGLATELSDPLRQNQKLGPELTFEIADTGLMRGFQLIAPNFEEGQDSSGFVFDDQESVYKASFNNALSIGDRGDYEDDDWRLILLDSEISAFALMFKDSAAQTGESMQLYLNNAPLLGTPIDMSSIGNPGYNTDFFFGITTDFLFDRIDFDEYAGSDDIAIADFRFASSVAVVPEPISSTLFLVGGATLGFRRLRKMKRA